MCALHEPEPESQSSRDDDRDDGARANEYPNLVAGNRERTVLDAVGPALLKRVVSDHLTVLQTAMTVFERNGDYATGQPPCGWCGVMDELSRPVEGEAQEAVNSGRWWCRASCRKPALDAMARGEVTQHDCPGGMRVYAVPIRAGAEIIGSISVGCGGPPSDEAELSALAERLCMPLERLRAEAARIKPFADELEPMASHAIEATARLIGEMVTLRRGAIEREDAHDLWVGMIAHDLRVPLSAALMAAELLKRSASRERVTELAQRIERSANKMRRMVEDLLEATRARLGGGIRLQLSRTSLDALAAGAIDELKLSLPDQVVHLHSEGNTELQCDAVRLDEVMGNLLANAARYGNGLPIHVDAVGSAEQVVLRVHNFGPPIPAELLPKIFAPFEQGRARVSNGRSAGLGLGLHIAREIAHAHGGTIEVASNAADGTAFTLSLPRSAPGSLLNAG